MYTACFVILLLGSIGALIASLWRAFKPLDLDRVKEYTVGRYAEFGLWAALSTIVVVWSDLPSYKYLLLALMFASLTLDFRYYALIIRLRQQKRLRDVPRRRWWPIADNLAWVAVVLVLYFA